MKRKPKRITIIREVVLNPAAGWKNHLKEYGLGPGVLYRDEIKYTDPRGRGFNSPMFEAECFFKNEELLKELFLVRQKPKRKK